MAQEIEPRSYSNTPIRMNFIAFGYGFLTGNILMDPSLPIDGLNGNIDVLFTRYTRSFSMGGRSAKVKVFLPWSSGDWSGSVEDEDFADLVGIETGFQTRHASGLGDARVTLEWNFFGAPATPLTEIAGYQQKTVVGVRFQAIAPTGRYDESRLINLGTNRWALRSEVGASWAVGQWFLEAAAGLWLFQDNTEFLEELTLSQQPLFVLKGQAIYSWRPGLLLSLGAGYGVGAQTKIDGVARDTKQKNWRFQLLFTYPVARNQGISVAVMSGVTLQAGPDFDALSLGYQYAWGGR